MVRFGYKNANTHLIQQGLCSFVIQDLEMGLDFDTSVVIGYISTFSKDLIEWAQYIDARSLILNPSDDLVRFSFDVNAIQNISSLNVEFSSSQ